MRMVEALGFAQFNVMLAGPKLTVADNGTVTSLETCAVDWWILTKNNKEKHVINNRMVEY